MAHLMVGADCVRNVLRVRDKLPAHPPDGGKSIQAYVLRVDGLVKSLLNLTLGDLETLPQQALTHDFTCLEGWTVPGVRWSGVNLETVLSLAGASPEARYVQASAGKFGISLERDAAAHALLAIHLDGTPVPSEYGGPVRLIVPGGDCFMNIKWLDNLELGTEPGANTAKTVALGRLMSAKEGGC
jgi:DMSO/TMAO reductase YedYZ molybdopterin-dependent catalytic subunit